MPVYIARVWVCLFRCVFRGGPRVRQLSAHDPRKIIHSRARRSAAAAAFAATFVVVAQAHLYTHTCAILLFCISVKVSQQRHQPTAAATTRTPRGQQRVSGGAHTHIRIHACTHARIHIYRTRVRYGTFDVQAHMNYVEKCLYTAASNQLARTDSGWYTRTGATGQQS